jgi:hypothetical protein
MSKLIAVYESLSDDVVTKDDPRRAGIISEMIAIKNAPTAKDAREIIEWWGWDSLQELDSWIIRARKGMGVK